MVREGAETPIGHYVGCEGNLAAHGGLVAILHLMEHKLS